MAEEFSAKYFKDMSEADFAKEVKRLNVDLVGKTGDDAINMVYNAELRRRGEELAKAEAQKTNPPAVKADVMTPDVVAGLDDDDELVDGGEPDFDLDSMTKAELSDYADEHDIVINAKANKDDIIAAIRAAEGKG